MTLPTDQQKRLRLLEIWQRQPSQPDSRWAGKSVLLIGSKGLVGICCLNLWLKAGAKVVALSRSVEPFYTHQNLTWLNGDLEDPKSWEGWNTLPETVICCAPIWIVAPVIPALAKAGVKRFVCFSSTSVHTKVASGKSKERALAATLSQGETDVLAAAKMHGIGATILRPTLIYGIGLDKNIASLARVIRKLPFFPLPLKANGLRQPVHAMDLAQATLDAAASPAAIGKAYDVGGAERIPYRAMVGRIADALPKKVIFIPVPFLAFAMDAAGTLLRRTHHSYGEVIRRMQKDMVFDDSTARSDFSWNPRAFLDAAKQPADTKFF